MRMRDEKGNTNGWSSVCLVVLPAAWCHSSAAAGSMVLQQYALLHHQTSPREHGAAFLWRDLLLPLVFQVPPSPRRFHQQQETQVKADVIYFF